MTPLRSNYRVKVDLTKYLRDARRFSWIYVDCENVSIINHVKDHIAEIFAIEEPFHLLLDGKDYLPPSEDARLLRENELISVVPGSGISEENNSTTSNGPQITRKRVKRDTNQQSVDTTFADCHQEKSNISSNDVKENCDKTLYNSFSEVCENNATAYQSLLDETVRDSKPSTPNITATDSFNPKDSSESAIHKRKRIRRKRSKNLADVSLPFEKVDSVPLFKATEPSFPGVSKHIHFNTADDEISSAIENNRDSEDSTSRANTTTREDKSVSNLATLLRLRQCSTPITFSNKKAKRTNDNPQKMEFSDTEVTANSRIKENGQTNGNKTERRGFCEEIPSNYEDLDVKEYCTLENTTKLNDIIAFKILRIGNEYTPEISDYIVARTINWCPKKLLYTFEILKGQEQIQSPLGKFSLPDDESTNEICDAANFNFSQLIDPRLIYRKL